MGRRGGESKLKAGGCEGQHWQVSGSPRKEVTEWHTKKADGVLLQALQGREGRCLLSQYKEKLNRILLASCDFCNKLTRMYYLRVGGVRSTNSSRHPAGLAGLTCRLWKSLCWRLWQLLEATLLLGSRPLAPSSESAGTG